MPRKKVRSSRKAKTFVYAMYADNAGIIRLSLETADIQRMAIRLADLQTLYRAVFLVTDARVVGAIRDKPRVDLATKTIMKAALNAKKFHVFEGRPRATEMPRPEGESASFRYVFVECRGASCLGDKNLIRPGFAFNHFADPRDAKRAPVVVGGLTSLQEMHRRAQKELRKKYGYRENEAV